MTLTLPILLRHAVASLGAPREQAQWVMSIDLSRGERWLLLALVSIVSTILTVVLEFLITGKFVFPLGLVQVTPITGAIATLSNGVISVFIVYWAGSAFKGTARFPDVISVLSWLQFILTCFLAAQIVLALAIPALLNMSNVVALVALAWLFCHFVAELHGFRSALTVFFATMAISAAFVLGLYILAGFAGLAVTGAPI